MNIPKSIKRSGRHLLSGLLLIGLSFPAIVNAQINEAHNKDYLAALESVAQAESRIAAAMLKVQTGEVAHYDFLQNEHIELIRHSRALAWPPGAIAQPQKTALKEDALALLNSAESLEWVIADFLRAVAQVRSATSNTLDIAAQASQEASSTLNASLNTLEVETLKFMASGYNEGWNALGQAYDSVLNDELSEQTRRELQFQKEQLVLFTPQLHEQMEALLESDVDLRAAHLHKLYDEAI